MNSVPCVGPLSDERGFSSSGTSLERAIVGQAPTLFRCHPERGKATAERSRRTSMATGNVALQTFQATTSVPHSMG